MNGFAEHFEYEAVTRLDGFGIKSDDLRDAVRWGVNHLSYCTANEPRNAPGFIVWAKTVRAIREKLLPLGWAADDTDNYATTISPDGSIAIAVAAGDERTGLPGQPKPTTKRAKGKVTKQRVHGNQLTFDDVSADFPAPKQRQGTQTWILLMFYDEETDEVRSELSLPASIESNGYISLWQERIGLPTSQLGLPQISDNEESNVVDFDIEPRAEEEGE